MNYLNKSILIILLVISISQVDAQQLPLYSQYWWNDYIINPAYTGSLNYSPLQMTYRKQWVGFNGSPELFTIGGHTRINEKFSIGGLIFKDQTGGAISQTGAMLNYCYRIRVNNNSFISLALSGQFNQYAFDNKKVQALTPSDPVLIDGVQKSLSPDASFGILFQKGQKTKIGFSVNQLFESRLSNLSDNSENTLVRHFNLSASQVFQLDSSLSIEPSVLIKKTIASPIQADLMARVSYKNLIWMGISYRYQDAIVGLVGFNFKNLYLGYSFDATLSELSSYSAGSHEIVFGCNFGNKNYVPLLDSDHDGVVDSLDHCPTIAGILENNGCPWADRDKDGIADNIDRCPDIAGIAKNNGCPSSDKDGDSIPDELDNCPNTKGETYNNGCPVVTQVQKEVVSKAISNLEFEFNKAEIKQESNLGLDMLAMLLSEKPDWKLNLAGHTDDVGSDEFNLQLSKDRAEAVRNYLVKKGLNSERFIVEYYGKSKPVTSNSSESGRKQNRRVEMTFVFE
jgi:type IX secretion system PorP/SprF family membrane protein